MSVCFRPDLALSESASPEKIKAMAKPILRTSKFYLG